MDASFKLVKVKIKNPITTPRTITEPIVEFCRAIAGPDAAPRYVRVQPSYGEPLNACFESVARRIERDGGTLQTGWTIWEFPFTFLEAEHHGVWLSPSGELVDLSPKLDREKQILFLPDPAHPWVRGEREAKRKVALRDHPLIHEYIRSTLRRESMIPKPGRMQLLSEMPDEYARIDRRCEAIFPALYRMYACRRKKK